MSTLRLGGVPEHFNYPWHLAMASPELADLDLDWTDQFGGTGEMISKLTDGQLDMVSILTEGTVAAIDDGLEATILQVYVESPLHWGIFVPASSSIKTLPELAEARIAISRFGSGSHLMAYVLADRDGWAIDPERFVVASNLDGAVAAFAAGEAELFLWDQYMTRPLVDSGDFRQLGVVQTPWPSFVFAVRNETLKARTTDVGRIVDAVVAQANALHSRPNIASELAERYELPLEAAEAWLSTTAFGGRAAMSQAVVESVRSTLASVGAHSRPSA